MSLEEVETKYLRIGGLRIPCFVSEDMKTLNEGDTVIIGEQKVTVMDREVNRQVPTKLRVDDQVIDLKEQRDWRFPERGDHFIQPRHVRELF